MNFETPLGLGSWIALGGLMAGVVALYFLKLRRRPVTVPSTYLWFRTIEDLHVNSLFQRLRRNLLLFLQLAALAAAMVALAGPRAWLGGEAGVSYVLIIDNSASMSAVDVKPSRLERAKTEARRILDRMRSSDRAMVLSFSDRARQVASYSSNRGFLADRIASIEAHNSTTDLTDALKVAAEIAAPRDGGGEDVAQASKPQVYVFSDGGFPPVKGVFVNQLSLHFVAVGADAGRNAAVTALYARRNLEGDEGLQVFAKVVNHSKAQMRCPVELRLDDRLIDAQAVALEPGAAQGLSFDLGPVDEGALELRLTDADDLTADNRAWAVIHPPRRARVLLITNGNYFLTKACRTHAATVDEEKPAYLATDAYRRDASLGVYDLIIYDECAPAKLPAAHSLFFGAMPPGAAFAKTTAAKNPLVIDWDAAHPLMRFLSFENVPISQARIASVPPEASVLVDSDRGPVVFVVPHQGFQHVVVAFRLVDSYWPLRASFPMFVLNCVNVLTAAGGPGDPSLRRPGQSVTIRPTPGVKKVFVHAPDGKVVECPATSTNRFDFARTEQLGVYAVEYRRRGTGVQDRFAVNLCSDAESNLAVRRELKVDYEQVAGRRGLVDVKRDIWKWPALLLLALVLFEWYVYNRRVYI